MKDIKLNSKVIIYNCAPFDGHTGVVVEKLKTKYSRKIVLADSQVRRDTSKRQCFLVRLDEPATCSHGYRTFMEELFVFCDSSLVVTK